MPDSDSRVRRPLLLYLCVVVVTALLWLMVTLSERHVHSVTFRVEWQGVDTARYVITHADQTVTFDVLSNGFMAIAREQLSHRYPLVFNVRHDTLLTGEACVEALQAQFNLPGIHGITCREKSISIRLSSRGVKGFVPQLKGLDVSFAEPYALYGTIQMKPDTVWLYGSDSSLARISRVETQPATLANVRETRTYELELNPVWNSYPDVHASTSVVSVTVPTARYTETEYTLPITLEGAPEGLRAHLYPSQVKVSLWVAEQDVSRLSAEQFRAHVGYDPLADSWKVVVDAFPSYVRIRDIEPVAVRYVIIQNK